MKSNKAAPLVVGVVGAGLALMSAGLVAQGTGQVGSPSRLQQKFSMASGQTRNVPIPVAGQPVKVLVATLNTAIPTLCHGNSPIGPGVVDPTVIKDPATGGVGLIGPNILVSDSKPPNPPPP